MKDRGYLNCLSVGGIILELLYRLHYNLYGIYRWLLHALVFLLGWEIETRINFLNLKIMRLLINKNKFQTY